MGVSDVACKCHHAYKYAQYINWQKQIHAVMDESAQAKSKHGSQLAVAPDPDVRNRRSNLNICAMQCYLTHQVGQMCQAAYAFIVEQTSARPCA